MHFEKGHSKDGEKEKEKDGVESNGDCAVRGSGTSRQMTL